MWNKHIMLLLKYSKRVVIVVTGLQLSKLFLRGKLTLDTTVAELKTLSLDSHFESYLSESLSLLVKGEKRVASSFSVHSSNQDLVE